MVSPLFTGRNQRVAGITRWMGWAICSQLNLSHADKIHCGGAAGEEGKYVGNREGKEEQPGDTFNDGALSWE